MIKKALLTLILLVFLVLLFLNSREDKRVDEDGGTYVEIKPPTLTIPRANPDGTYEETLDNE